jgi:hypothetical protein
MFSGTGEKDEDGVVGVDGVDGPVLSFFQSLSFTQWLLLVTFSLAAAIAGFLLVLAVVGLYHKRYPVRMRFGRRFSTFENPIYRSQQSPGVTSSKELRRLTGDDTSPQSQSPS